MAPLALMRGRTLNDSFVILDEAQNTTSEQMKMFLTRLGFNFKAVITGDITQIDLPVGKNSGLVEAMEIPAASPESAWSSSAKKTLFATTWCSRSSAHTRNLTAHPQRAGNGKATVSVKEPAKSGPGNSGSA